MAGDLDPVARRLLERARRTTGLPESAALDERSDQPLADRGIYYVVLEDGIRTAWNGANVTTDPCVVCDADPERMPTCKACAGTGEILHVPFANRPWDQIVPGLYQGGLECQPGKLGGYATGQDGNVVVSHEFDFVVSLAWNPGYGPALGVKHETYRMSDSDLDPVHHTALDEVAERVLGALVAGERVLVRCHAGLNRSGLVVGLVMLKMGWSVDDILKRIRAARSPYALFNSSFVSYLREVESA